ncbi:alpha-1,4-glucan:maltose-1-phosphate maltosyltransferase [Azorhizobium oxalatiphilum]|uniref:Alpha-1,4-glucan:maltose-1-phosphate maltosyltransferase n=1 Tax=Azorhizobium oxalatiphilum TaxID=980631 RepID=A0A917BN32_9HYPH|nr:maltotransferase domain-containing protein [Azorhizobium oxalatiphilum]GGF47160.1 alpha-1,4-glucan:maltose-1-phosphate maltosyltransferase [Azorhizobium oxalatiphilum]
MQILREPLSPRPLAGLAKPLPRLYLVHPLWLDGLDGFGAVCDHAAGLGFNAIALAPPFATGRSGNIFLTADHDRLNAALGTEADAVEGLAALVGHARSRGLDLYLDLVIDRVAVDGLLPALEEQWFLPRTPEDGIPDPRRAERQRDAAYIAYDEPDVALAASRHFADLVAQWTAAGVHGFRCDAPHRAPAAVWAEIIGAGRLTRPDTIFLAWTPGVPADAVAALAGSGFDGAFASTAWWDFRKPWMADELARLNAIGQTLGCPEAPFGPRLSAQGLTPSHVEVLHRRALDFSAAIGDGLLVPTGFEYGARDPLDPARGAPSDLAFVREAAPFDLGPAIRAANARLAARSGAAGGPWRLASAPGASVAAFVRPEGDGAALVLANGRADARTNVDSASVLPRALGFGRYMSQDGQVFAPGTPVDLGIGQVVRFTAAPHAPVLEDGSATADVRAAARVARLAIEAVSPAVDDGAFPIRRIVGERVEVEADVVTDGHDVIAVALLWRPADVEGWNEVPMTPLGNDRYAGAFPLERMGRHLYAVAAWRDAFGSFHHELEAKVKAGVPVSLEIREGVALAAAATAPEDHAEALGALQAELAAAPEERQQEILLADETVRIMRATRERPFATQSAFTYAVDAEREGAGFASWYEIFPRSTSGHVTRHGTFADVIADLPRIRDMGFDVLYFPPIHPIGEKNRKGRDNTLTPGPDDPGSPYAIGSKDGGHADIHRQLGTAEDFLRLVASAKAHGLEIALDFAIQCAPDHPWLTEHPGWFAYRPDGSIRYAENPPKKYQDIVNVDFYAKDAVPGLWLALRDVVLHWVEQGVKLFRVDNPHTKPLPFWQWLIADVRGKHPDTVFLAEAFTKPKMMYRLAKVGFSQSYTYFTWRNTKTELTSYLEELCQPPVSDIYRPHFFVTTPDINPYYLQTSGQGGFLTRAALAATLSGLWGVFSGFELCEAKPVPGKEEYASSDKYEIRARDYSAPGNIVAEITRLNRIRRENPALHTHKSVLFLNAWNDNVLAYAKATPSRDNLLVVAVNLDPHAAQEVDFEIPLWELDLPDHASVEVEDLMTDTSFRWTGKVQHARLDPAALPFAIWRLSRVEG